MAVFHIGRKHRIAPLRHLHSIVHGRSDSDTLKDLCSRTDTERLMKIKKKSFRNGRASHETVTCLYITAPSPNLSTETNAYPTTSIPNHTPFSVTKLHT